MVNDLNDAIFRKNVFMDYIHNLIDDYKVSDCKI